MYFSSHTITQLRRVQSLIDRLDPNTPPQALLVPGSPQPRHGVIVFTGSFNPPTTAHIALLKQAQQFAQQHGGMQIYAAFSKRTVDKETVERPLLVERVLLLDRILQKHLKHPGILLFNRGLYVEQSEAIRASFPHVKTIFFLMGFDKIVQILDPHYYQDRDAALTALFKRVHLLVAPRGDADEDDLQALLHQPHNTPFARFIHPLPFNPLYRTISSTHIRQSGSTFSHDVPQEVQAFLRHTHAYTPPLQRPDGTTRDLYQEHMQQVLALIYQGSSGLPVL